MTAQIQLEPEAQAFSDANAKPPFLFELDAKKGRAVQPNVVNSLQPCVCLLRTIHDFVMLNALAETSATRGAMSLAVTWLREAFSNTFAYETS